MKYEAGAWTDVSGGEQLFNTSADLNAPILSFDEADNLYVLYHYDDETYQEENRRTVLAKYADGAWSTISNFGDASLFTSDTYPTFAFDPDHSLYMLEKRRPWGQTTMTMTTKKYNGTVWEDIGAAAFAEAKESLPPIVDLIDLKFDGNGIPYLTFPDVDRGGKLTVMKYDGSSWSPVSNPGFSGGFYGSAWSDHIIDKDGNIYVFYVDLDSDEWELIVMKYDPSLDSTD